MRPNSCLLAASSLHESTPDSPLALDPLALWRGIDDAVRHHLPALRFGGPIRPTQAPLPQATPHRATPHRTAPAAGLHEPV